MAKNLFGEFDVVSAKAWKQKIQADLKGADYNDSLVWESPEGIGVKPFYNSEDLKKEKNQWPNTASDWKIGQEIFSKDAKNANAKALDAIQRGAESLIFTIATTETNIEALLGGIDLDQIPLYFNLQFLDATYVKRIQKLSNSSKSEIHLNIDIIGNLTRSGNWFFDLNKDYTVLENIVANSKFSIKSSVLGVDISLYQNAGATMVQQLAYAIAHANEYLNHSKFGLEQGITFKVSVGTNYFFEIAKLKALRLLWHTLASEYDISAHCNILVTPTKRNKTLYSYNVNMLRSTAECMSAIFGGADTVYNLPYDSQFHKNNEFGERMARNQLLIMKNEGYLDKVGNPSDGAYYIESLTVQLAQKALDLFKNIEKGGGFLSQLKDQTIQKKIKESAQKEQLLFDRKENILVGTNRFENNDDHMKSELERDPFLKLNKRKTLLEPILEKRLAEAIEQKRLNDE